MRVIAVPQGIVAGHECKGRVTAYLAKVLKVNRIIRYGGCNGSHTVLDRKLTHSFSHYGSTLSDVNTTMVNMVMSHELLFTEARRLEELGIAENMDTRMNIHEGCLCVTPYHGAISRLSEYVLALTGEKKGTVGLGVGRAIIDSRKTLELAIRAEDFRDQATLEIKLAAIRAQKIEEAQLLLESRKVTELSAQMETQMEILSNEGLVIPTAKAMAATGSLVRIIDDDELTHQIQSAGNLIVEGSHGTLLHPRFGFVPHVGQVDSTAAGLLENLREIVNPQDILRLGIMASYSYRLGAGPLVTQDNAFGIAIDEDLDPESDSFIGPFRIGPLDVLALQYAIDCVGGPSEYGGIALSHLDHLNAFASEHNYWPICTGYTYEGESANLEPYFFLNQGLITGIRVHPDTKDEAQQCHQRELTRLLKRCKPVIERITGATGEAIEQKFVSRLEEELKVPIVLKAYGPDVTDVRTVPDFGSFFE